MKLRQNNKWDSRAPTSGRVADSSDVMYTWNKLKALGNYKNDIYYDAKVAPDAPVESINAPDAGTIVIKLKKPSTVVAADPGRLAQLLFHHAQGGRRRLRPAW